MNNRIQSTKMKESSGSFATIYGACVKDPAMQRQKLPYPKSVFFIIVNEFCERFSYYGMKAVLTIYLVNVLAYGEDDATKIYHIFSGLCYFTPIFGAMIADSFLGKFKTILYLSIVYAVGNVILSLASLGATPSLQFLPPIPLSMIGLALIALGTGGIKPCVSAFGGDQFTLPQQEQQLSTFFSIFYFAINAGSLISTFITPIFRKDIQCFGSDTCYPLAFGVPACLMVTALVIFIIGKPWYRMVQADGNIAVKVGGCVAHAIRTKKAVKKGGDKREHFLDYADNKYEKTLIEDIKILLRILVLYIPLPFFWALFDQQGSRWTLQATRMDGKLGSWLIKPDQMQVINPFLILALIPLFDQILYPGLKKMNLLTKPLQRLTAGGILAGVAFIISGLLELRLETTYAVQLKGQESQIHLINTLGCPLNVTLVGTEDDLNSRKIESMGMTIISKIPAGNYSGQVVLLDSTGACKGLPSTVSFSLIAEPEKAFSYLIESVDKSIKVNKDRNEDHLEKSKEGSPKLKILLVNMEEEISSNATLNFINDEGKIVSPSINLHENASSVFETDAKRFNLQLLIPGDESSNVTNKVVNINETIEPHLGGNYVVVLMKNSASNQVSATSYTITEPNTVHMLWLLPQYIIITIAEVMFSVTGLEFSFAQAPSSMKSVIQAAWLLTVAFGNLIVVFIAEFIKFDSQASEFFLFAGLMFVDMIVFAVMAYFYKPAKIHQDDASNIPMESN